MSHERYSRPAMSELWSDQHRFNMWRRVEQEVLAVQYGNDWATDSVNWPAPTPEQVLELEAITKHDFVAFLRAWTKDMPLELSSKIHRGLTSSDVIDTALSWVLKDVCHILVRGLQDLETELKELADGHVRTLRTGRTHGQWAEPTSFGAQVRGWYYMVERARQRIQALSYQIAVTKISGPVGTYSHISPKVEQMVGAEIAAEAAIGSTQVWARDRIADFGHACAQAATACEYVGMQIRLGSQSGIEELAETRPQGATGSSAMPHKQNPVRSERLSGLSRLVRNMSATLYEDIVLWGERDISHSSVERAVLPQISCYTDFAIQDLISILQTLTVNTDKMRRNLTDAEPEIYSSAALVQELAAENVDPTKVYAKIQGGDYDLPGVEAELFLTNIDALYRPRKDNY